MKRSDVPSDFAFIAPVRVEFDGGKAGYLFMNIKDDEQTISRDLPVAPKIVTFAPNYSLLANIRKE